MKVGDLVKSYDFVGEYSCYMLGLVTEISEETEMVKCAFISRVFNNEAVTDICLDTFSAPMNGAFMLDRPDFPRIVVCE